jgi:vitamin B12/bleomycin/antimicrobial peptide transport system ATP-binding/permease protein
MSPPRRCDAVSDRRHLIARFWKAASKAWHERQSVAIGLVIFLIIVALLQLLMQLVLNLWNRNFFDALGRRDARELWIQAELFFPLAAVSIVLAATSVWGRMTAQRYWREALTRHVLNQWLEKDRFRKIGPLVEGTQNPEYRIAVDIRTSTDAPIDLVLALFSSIVTSIAFFGVLWTVGGNIDVMLLGHAVTIPGYLVLGVIIYSGIVTGLMIFVGRHLPGIIERMNQSEAEFRAAVDAFRLDGGASRGEKRGALWLKLKSVLYWWRALCWQLMRTTLVSSGNVLLAPVVAWILCAPKYLSGAMSLGELTQTAAAFVTVQSAFNWLVDNFQRLADWRASAHRLSTLLVALDELEVEEPAAVSS